MRTQVFALPLVSLIAVACSNNPPPHVAESTTPPTTTSATASKPSQGPLQPASAHLSVDEDVARLCGIQTSGATAGATPKFETDDSELTPEDTAVLAKIGECMTTGALKGKSLDLVGRTDSRGTTEYNFPLGGKRAHAVSSYLEHVGVEHGRLGESSRGELDAKGTDEASWAADRRVDIRLHPSS